MIIRNINKLKKAKGFTLIELIVVIAVIMVLAGFLMPKFAAYQAKAKETKAINTAKQIQTAAMTSYSDQNGKFVADSVSSAVALLTQTGAVDSTGGGTSVSVSYKSDNEDYLTVINEDSSYKVYKGADETTQIYPKQ